MKRRVPKTYKKSKKNKSQIPYVSGLIDIDIADIKESWHRAELVIHNLDGSAFSYEGRVFLNNPKADQNTALSLDNGYLGSYHVFGYGGLPDTSWDIYREKDRFDYRRMQSPLIPYKRIVVTDALRSLGQSTREFRITIVPVLPDNNRSNVHATDIIKFDKIGIIIR